MTLARLTDLTSLPLSSKVRSLASQLRQKITPRAWPPRPSVTAASLDLTDPDVALDPFPYYEELRRNGPVHFLPQHGYWLVLGFDEVSSALRQPQLFSSRVPEWLTIDQVILGADPPEHTAVRRIVGQYFSAQALEVESTFTEQAAERLLKPLSAGGKLDVLREFSAPLSEDVAAHLIGFDEATFAEVREVQGSDGDLSHWLAALESTIGARANRIPIYESLLRNSDGLLDEADCLSLVRFLWIAGTTTTRRVIASSVLMLLRHTPIRSQIESDPTLMSAFVEESIRLHPPEHSISRVTTGEVELSDTRIPAGALVKLCVGAANRDPAQFDQPATLLLNRMPNNQLSFGGGIHRCVGSALARMEVAAALRVLIRLAPEYRSVEPLGSLRYAGFTNDAEHLVIEC